MTNALKFLLTLIVVVLFFPALFLGGAWVVQQVHAPVTPAGLAQSLGNEAGGAFIKGNKCAEVRRDHWTCLVSDESGSGRFPYVVDVEPDSSCWTARAVDGRGKPVGEPISGCVNHFEAGWWGLFFGSVPIPSRP